MRAHFPRAGFGRAAIGFIAFLGLAPAFAADLPLPPPLPEAPAESWRPFAVRLRAVLAAPVERSRVSTPFGAVPGAFIGVSNAVFPELSLSYSFTRNVSIEAICCASLHKNTARGTIAALGKVGDVLTIAPTATVKYQFMDLGAFQPYVGVGASYAFFRKRSTGPAFTGLKMRDSAGLVAQVGFDYMLTEALGLNFDVKRIAMRTKVRTSIYGGAVPVEASMKLNPWLVGAGVTYRF